MSIFSFLFKKKNKFPIIELFPEALVVFSSDMELLEANSYAKRLLNLQGNELVKPDDIFDCDFDILSKELLQEDNICTLKLKNADIFVEVKASQKDPEKIYFSLRDVTQKHKTVTSFMKEYENSKKVNRTKNNLLVKLSNELTSPLHSITGFSQAMLEGLSGKIDSKQERYLKIINNNAFDLLHFIEQLVDSAKLETGAYEFETKSFDIVDLVNSLLNDIKENNPNIKTYVEYSELAKRGIYADDAVLRKIMGYFVANLLKASEFGEINIKLESPDAEFVNEHGFIVDENYQPKNFLHIEITSNNDCTAEKAEDSVFEIYPQLEKNAKREVINNLPLYNADLLSRYLKIKLDIKTSGKAGFDILLNVEKP